MDVALGHPTRDLSPSLRQHLWSSQQFPEMLLVSDPSRYMWLLGCQKHLRCMTVQAACRQHQNPKHYGQLAQCERCTCSYKLGPEPLPDDKHRSYWEQVAWIQLERVLQLVDVKHYMSGLGHLHGSELGYVVEARIVKGWPAGVDIYVPSINLILQVDGEHHDAPPQQQRDSRFNALAIGAGHRVLRLHHKDVVSFSTDILSAVRKCMQCAQSAWLLCSQHHPLVVKPML
jgi:hypothetical protein